MPAAVWEDPDIETLGLADDDLGRLKRLRMLEIGELDGSTDFLYLHDNQLAELPDSLARLTRLRFLNISGNRFSAIPKPCSA